MYKFFENLLFATQNFKPEYGKKIEYLEVFKNPNYSELQDCGPWARGIIMYDSGDLYFTQYPGEIIHSDFPKILNLNDLNIRKMDYGYLQQYKNTNKIYLGESMTTSRKKDMDKEEKEIFQKAFKKSKMKNPDLKFIMENIMWAKD